MSMKIGDVFPIGKLRSDLFIEGLASEWNAIVRDKTAELEAEWAKFQPKKYEYQHSYDGCECRDFHKCHCDCHKKPWGR